MKTIAPALLAAIESGTVATLIKVTLTNGAIYGYTDHDAPLTVDGQEYVPIAGQSVLKMNLTSDATVSTQDVVAGWTPVLSEQAVLEGLYDFAQVEYALCSWVAPPSYAQTILGDQPRAYWPLDETTGTVAYDKSGNGLNGTIEPGVTLGQPGIPGAPGAMLFNGSSGYIDVPASSLLCPLTEGSVEAWVKINNYSAIGDWVSTGENGGYRVRSLSGSASIVYSNANQLSSPSALPTGYVHVVVTFSASGSQIYQNGVLVASGGAAYSQSAGTAALHIGACIQYREYFNGLLSNVAIYDMPLSAAQVSNHYNAGMDFSALRLSAIPIFGGRIGKITYIDKGFSAQAFSNMWNLSQYIGIEFTANCRHKFGATQDPQGVGGCFYNASGQVYQGAIVGSIINAVEFYVGMNANVPATPNSPTPPQLSATPVLPSQSGGTQYLAPTEGAPYSYSVSAIVDGIESAPSPISSIYTALFIQGLPTFWQSLFQAVLPGNAVGSTITLSWNAVPGATAYNVYGRFNQTLLATVTGTSWTDNGSASGGTIAPPYSDFFSQGFLTMTSGQASGLSREVKFCHSGKLQLWLPLERPVAVGDTFNIQVGCIKTLPACQFKFANQLNFGGFAGIKPQALYTTPQTGTGTSVKK